VRHHLGYLLFQTAGIRDACCLKQQHDKVIISRSKKLSRLMTDRRRVNCETGEAATPDLSTKNRTNASILFLQSHIWVERVKQTLRIAATLYLSTENGVNVSIYFCRAISGLRV
jgi:hypothetical protein